MSKSFFKSKTFWINALGAGAAYLGFIPMDPQVLFYVSSGVNIALRALTKGPVYVIKDAAEEP